MYTNLRNNLFLAGIIITFSFIILTIIHIQKDTTILNTIWNVSLIKPQFSDIRTITAYNETIALGENPYLNNIADPYNRVMNYPPFWAYFAKLTNISHSNAIFFGFFNIILLYIGFLFWSFKINNKIGISILLIICFFSPSTLLLMERGNIDMIVFFLISIGILSSNIHIFNTLILLAAFVKVFPIFSIFSNINSKKNWISIFITLFIFSIYIFAHIQDIKLMKEGTPQPTGFAYGINIIWMIIKEKFNNEIYLFFKYFSYIYVVILIFIFYKIRNINSLKITCTNETTFISFKVGAIIYITTFLLNNNWDYRLVFLIFSIPQLYTWFNSKDINIYIRILSAISIFLIVHTMWYLKINLFFSINVFIDEIFNWLLFTFLFLLLILPKKQEVSEINNETK
ncbi:hypothetical protein CP985_14480 [Malaciobacter mytili LMG 24559]|uniref:DUF2029 domain-containing protein n=2 Tax=Arcobacteraceae TaxID=2808963 RepID=A0AAX2ABL7_9BACT|nr:hypothetical protein [Malaciobacter mytili]AXH14467.1 putative membrane protein [Malaciobacter mytili LMG 24559]RXK12373.1 hypothetical protein CP985_14480 [Malaciobacter mytili LMG 24559]